METTNKTAKQPTEGFGLRHNDGTPLTLAACLAWASEIDRQAENLTQLHEALTTNPPCPAYEVEDLAAEIKRLRTVSAAWLALAEVFKAYGDVA